MSREHRAEEFEALAMPLLASLYNFAHWLSQDRDEAEDLVQETYVKALKAFSSFQLGTNFRAWMFRILRNTFLTSRTGLKSSATVPIDSEEDESMPVTTENPESIAVLSFDIELLRRGIEQLPVPFREVLLLCDLEEMTYHEVAESLSIPIGTVMSRLSRARRMLRESLRGSSKEAGA